MMVFTCNLNAIPAAERPRYQELVNSIRAAVRERSEIANGYTFGLDSKAVTLPEAAEWISMERLCCPFLTLQLSASGQQPHWILTLTGPEGVKPLLDAEFPAEPKRSRNARDLSGIEEKSRRSIVNWAVAYLADVT